MRFAILLAGCLCLTPALWAASSNLPAEFAEIDSSSNTPESRIMSLMDVEPGLPLKSSTDPKGHGTLVIDVDGIMTTQGVIQICVFDKKQGFPNRPEYALRHRRFRINGPTIKAEFENTVYGTYAVCAFHDENSNEQLDMTWNGKPKEGLGVSNHVMGPYTKKPVFKESSFKLARERAEIFLTLQY